MGKNEWGKNDPSAAYFAAVENAWRVSALDRHALVEKARVDPNPFASVLHSRLREGARLFARAREEENKTLFPRDVVPPEEGVGERAVVAAAEAVWKNSEKAPAAAAKERHAPRSRVSPADARVARRVPLVAVPPEASLAVRARPPTRRCAR